MAPERRGRSRRTAAVVSAVVALALLTPTVVLLRLTAYVGAGRPTISTGPARQYFDPLATPFEVAVGGAEGDRSVTVAAPQFPPFRDVGLAVRLRSVPAGTTVTATALDAGGAPVTSCGRTAAEAGAVTLTCPLDRPELVRTLAVTADGAPGAVVLEARRDRYGETAGELVGSAPPDDLVGRLERSLDRIGVLRPAAASPAVLLSAWAASLALSGLAVLALLRREGGAPGDGTTEASARAQTG